MQVLVDSLFINNSGGKILLDYLVEVLEDRGLEVFYLFDERTRKSFEKIPAERRVFLRGSLKLRHQFYKANRARFSRVLCLGNLPPTVRLEAKVLTYLHQLLYFVQPSEVGFRKRCKLLLKIWITKSVLQNTDYWGVQSENVADLMESKWGVSRDKIKILPFYPPLQGVSEVSSRDNKYLFVSGGNSHKNHDRLLDAFAKFSKIYPEAELHLTIPANYPDLLYLINGYMGKGVKIVNHGFIPRQELASLYSAAGFVAYPSLIESFGLGLIEAIESGCKVIASNLPYVHAVCEPSLVFEPLNIASIYEALLASKAPQVPPSYLKTENQIDHIISFLAHETINTVV